MSLEKSPAKPVAYCPISNTRVHPRTDNVLHLNVENFDFQRFIKLAQGCDSSGIIHHLSLK